MMYYRIVRFISIYFLVTCKLLKPNIVSSHPADYAI